jgi:UDP-N-acetylenolpyruvoylglucosamine reductase
MNIQKNISLSKLTTMKLGGVASFVVEIKSKIDIETAYLFAEKSQLSTYIISGGSNIVAKDEGFNGLILLNKITGITVVEKTDSGAMTLKIGSGEILDNVVSYTVKRGLTGMEALSSIPGTIGGAAIQNSGAYGQDISQIIHSVEVFDTVKKEFKTLLKSDIKYGYRQSAFNSKDKGHYFITAVCITLKTGEIKGELYRTLQHFLDTNNSANRSPETIRNAVMSIRADKLPDPKIIPSAGSFFKNTMLTAEQAEEFKKTFPNMPIRKKGTGFEVSSGWLIEDAGLKGKLLHGMRVSDKAALVLINESAKSYTDLDAARSEIIQTVRDKFGLELAQEPEEL